MSRVMILRESGAAGLLGHLRLLQRRDDGLLALGGRLRSSRFAGRERVGDRAAAVVAELGMWSCGIDVGGVN